MDHDTWTLLPRPANELVLFDTIRTALLLPLWIITVVRLLVAIASQNDWEVDQVYFSNAFLQGKLDREVYMQRAHVYQEGFFTI